MCVFGRAGVLVTDTSSVLNPYAMYVKMVKQHRQCYDHDDDYDIFDDIVHLDLVDIYTSKSHSVCETSPITPPETLGALFGFLFVSATAREVKSSLHTT